MNGSRVARAAAVELADAIRPDDFAGACVLLLLGEQLICSAADLRERLDEIGLREDEVGPPHMILRALERAGLVRASDPAALRPTYRLTALGRERRELALRDLQGTQVLISHFLARCEERIVRELPRAT